MAGHEPRPRPTIAVGVAVFSGERVLLVQRASDPHRGHWTLPGGRVELGESLREAAGREVAEECGVHVAVANPVLILNRVVRDERATITHHYVIVDFIAEYDAARNGQPVPGSDALAVRWTSPAELAGLPLTPHLDRYLQIILTARHDPTPGCALVEEL